MEPYLLKSIKLEDAYQGPKYYPTGTNTESYTLEIRNGKVSKIYQEQEQLPDLLVVDGLNYLVLPSLREMHCHLKVN
jgi:cytosine/adenosine deaminase-related metal-dependent hydrolase